MHNFEILIKSFLRMGCLKRLLDSIIKHYPSIVVRIADDSVPEKHIAYPPKQQSVLERVLRERKEIVEFVSQYPNLHFYSLPFDSGLSAGRNFLVDKVETPYFVIMDDDFVVTKRTDLNKLHQVIESDKDIVLVGGRVADKGTSSRRRRPGKLVKRPDGNYVKVLLGVNCPRIDVAGVKCILCRYVPNFFMASAKLIRKHELKWEEELKIGNEHAIFFITMPTELKIYYTGECTVDHWPSRNLLYRRFRIGRIGAMKRKANKILGCMVTPGAARIDHR